MLPKQTSHLCLVPTLWQGEQCPPSEGREKEGGGGDRQSVWPFLALLTGLMPVSSTPSSSHTSSASLLSLLPSSPSPLPPPAPLFLSRQLQTQLLCWTGRGWFSVLLLGNLSFFFYKTKVGWRGTQSSRFMKKEGNAGGAGLRPTEMGMERPLLLLNAPLITIFSL